MDLFICQQNFRSSSTFMYVFFYDSVGKDSICNSGDLVQSLDGEDPVEKEALALNQYSCLGKSMAEESSGP